MRKQNKNTKLSSEDFLKKVDKMWKPGPQVKYTRPDAWDRALS